MEYHELTIADAKKMLLERKITSVELTSKLLDRIELYDNEIASFITVDRDLALEQAKASDKKILSGETGALTGIPIALKDLLCTKGMKTTCGSQILDNFVPQYDGTVVKKIKEAGAVIIGKTNLDEFAMGSSTENSSYKITTNPWNKTYVPGGQAAGPLLQLRHSFVVVLWGQIQAAPFVNRHPIVVLLDSNRHTGGYPDSDWFLMHHLWIRLARLQKVLRMRPYCSM